MRELRRQSLEPVGAGADRMRHDVVAVGLHHFARHRRIRDRGERRREARPRLGELELQRVAVERANALDVAVVVERLFLAQRAVAHLFEADDAVLVERGCSAGLFSAGS